MTRLGWAILALIVTAGALFATMLRFGGGASSPPAVATASPPSASPVQPLPPGRVAWGKGLLTVPVAGVSRAQIVASWGDPRDGGARVHRGNDIMAPGGTPVLAAADGIIEKLYWSEGGGGNTLYVRSPDGRWSYYYAHLSAYAPGIAEGDQIKAGQAIGAVGDTGNAGPGNTHLHFGMSVMAPGDRWWQGRAVDPTPLLAGPSLADSDAHR